jgi:hypothetical protein
MRWAALRLGIFGVLKQVQRPAFAVLGNDVTPAAIAVGLIRESGCLSHAIPAP